jgi:alpha-L-fucosidase
MSVPPASSRRTLTALGATAALVLALCAVLAAPAAPARAELFNPRQRFLRASTGGLFLHWGMRTAPGYTDCAAWEKAVTDGGWDPRYWVNEAKKLHVQYLVLASFHSRLGYARAWPSAIPGTCSTKRDFLGELIRAADAEGLRVVLYMTDDPKWYAEGLPEGRSWMDSAAYSAYKGRAVDLHTREGFGEFSYDNFVEVMKRYPRLSGFWIDNDNEYWEQHGLYERIRRERPDMTLSNNNEDTPIMDMVSHEQKVGMTPPYDYPQAVWTPQPRLTEGEWKLPVKGAWWYDGTDSDVDARLTLGRLVANAGSSIKSLMAETAMVNGRFPPKQEAFNDFAAGYLDRIWESVHGVEGGGYMYGGLQPGFWNDGAHGVTTISKRNPDLQYVHVLTRPASGDAVTVRDNGYKIRRVTDLRTGERMRFEQGNGSFTIEGVTGWDPYDTVFRVETAGRHGIYPGGMVTATASASADGHPAAHLTDHDYLTWWDKGDALPVTVDLRLPRPLPVRYLAINQREWSPTYNRETFGRPEDSARIKDYKVYVSDDGVHWGDPVKTGVLESERGVRFIDLPATTARHVRLEVDSTWAAATAPNFYNRLQIDEMWLGASYVR